jgi:hypothetical protein
MDWKKTLTTQGLKLMSDPRVLQLMQDERFMKLMMSAMSMPGKVQNFTDGQKDSLIDSMGLATRQEVEDLQRTVRALEEQVSALQELLGKVLETSPEFSEEKDG